MSERISFKCMGLDPNVLWFLLFYAFGDGEKVKALGPLDATEGDGIFDPIASALVRAIQRQRRAGFSRNYVERLEETSVPRGRIDMPSTLALRMRRSSRVGCVADDYLPDTMENRVIKATVKELARESAKKTEAEGVAAVSGENARKLRGILPMLEGISDLPPRSKVDLSHIRLHRNNAGYRLIMMMCALVLRHGARAIREICEDEQKTGEAFEAAIRAYFASRHPELHARDEWFWRGNSGDDSVIPRLHTDITLMNEETRKSLVIDAKCYRRPLSGDKLRPEHCNQLLTYVLHTTRRNKLQAENASGLLLYAGHSDANKQLSEKVEWIELDHKLEAMTLELVSTEDKQGLGDQDAGARDPNHLVEQLEKQLEEIASRLL